MDLVSGSMSFNRLEFQISQSLMFIIDIYEQWEDFVLTLDYYDDITIFDSEDMNHSVCYYQVKTTEDVKVDHIIKNEWLNKLYEHLTDTSDLEISEIGLVTSSVVRDKNIKIVDKGKKKFTDIPENVRNKIIQHLADSIGCTVDEIDITKFAFIKTSLTKDTHHQLVENRLTELLRDKNPDINLRTSKLTFQTLIELMVKKQAFEVTKTSNPSREDIRKNKSITKKEFSDVIKYASSITLPEYYLVEPYVERFFKDFSNEIMRAYVQILSDIKNKDKLFYALFNNSLDIWNNGDCDRGDIEQLPKFVEQIKSKNRSNVHVFSNDYYAETISLILFVKEVID